jgi:hypothetical protein
LEGSLSRRKELVPERHYQSRGEQRFAQHGAIRDAERFVWRGELDSTACGERLPYFPISLKPEKRRAPLSTSSPARISNVEQIEAAEGFNPEHETSRSREL